MTQDHATGTDRVQALRDAFDSTFSLAPPPAGDPPEDLLVLRRVTGRGWGKAKRRVEGVTQRLDSVRPGCVILGHEDALSRISAWQSSISASRPKPPPNRRRREASSCSRRVMA